MRRKCWPVLVTAGICALAIWLNQQLHGEKPTAAWQEVAPGIWRSTDLPHGYALVDNGHALLIDAAHSAEGLMEGAKVSQIDRVLLTHHHLDTCAKVDSFLVDKIPVQAPRASAPWLTPAGVQQFWKESIPLRNSRTAYFVVPVGFEKIDCSLDDGQVIDWRGWKIQVFATPGHTRDHVAYLASRERQRPERAILFCGDAMAQPGCIATPFTTDWDHWTDAGLTPTAQSLRKLAALKPKAIFPAHGEPVRENTVAALEKTAANVEEVAFLKSFERFSKQRLGKAPSY